MLDHACMHDSYKCDFNGYFYGSLVVVYNLLNIGQRQKFGLAIILVL